MLILINFRRYWRRTAGTNAALLVVRGGGRRNDAARPRVVISALTLWVG